MGTKVSIVLPTYNGSRYLRDSIDSCLAQTYKNIELIVVDDASTDSTPEILNDYGDDPRIHIVRHAQNQKLPAALNTGFARATGQYLTWTSDDNLFAPQAVAQLVTFLEDHPDIGLVYADHWLIDNEGKVVRRASCGLPALLDEKCGLACFLYRREVYDRVGEYDTAMFRIEDYDYWLRVRKAFKLAWYAEPLYYYRRHSGSLTAMEQMRARLERLAEVQEKHLGPDPRRLSRLLASACAAEAFECHERGDRAGVLKFALRALARKPSLIGNRGVPSIMLQALLGRRLKRPALKSAKSRG